MSYELATETQFYIGKGLREPATDWLASQGLEVPKVNSRCLHRR